MHANAIAGVSRGGLSFGSCSACEMGVGVGKYFAWEKGGNFQKGNFQKVFSKGNTFVNVHLNWLN